MSSFIPVDRQTDFLFPPSVQDWLSNLDPQPWMLKVAVKSKDL